MRGVSAIIESVLLGAAIAIFTVLLVGFFARLQNNILEERTREILLLNCEKTAYALALAAKTGEKAGSSEVEVPLDMSIPFRIRVKGPYLVCSKGRISEKVPLLGLDKVYSITGSLTSSELMRAFVRYENKSLILEMRAI